MSEISYVFMPMPFEFMTGNFLDDPIMMRFIDWIMRRISPNPSVIPLKGKQLFLAPYEFMFGRVACALAAGISVKNARTRLNWLIGLGYVKKVASKGSSTYSVYSLETGAFRQIVKSQQIGQQLGQRKGQRTGHNLEAKIPDSKIKEETSNVSSKAVDRSSFSNKEKNDLQGLLAYCQDKGLQISGRALRRWLRVYESDRITDNLSLLLNDIDGIKNQEAWMEVAMKENYSWQNRNTQENRRFAEDFMRENRWTDLKITQSYCCHQPSSKDYPFKLPPEAFRDMLTECYRQYYQN